jgi:hypothetical protein
MAALPHGNKETIFSNKKILEKLFLPDYVIVFSKLDDFPAILIAIAYNRIVHIFRNLLKSPLPPTRGPTVLDSKFPGAILESNVESGLIFRAVSRLPIWRL